MKSFCARGLLVLASSLSWTAARGSGSKRHLRHAHPAPPADHARPCSPAGHSYNYAEPILAPLDDPCSAAVRGCTHRRSDAGDPQRPRSRSRHAKPRSPTTFGGSDVRLHDWLLQMRQLVRRHRRAGHGPQPGQSLLDHLSDQQQRQPVDEHPERRRQLGRRRAGDRRLRLLRLLRPGAGLHLLGRRPDERVSPRSPIPNNNLSTPINLDTQSGSVMIGANPASDFFDNSPDQRIWRNDRVNNFEVNLLQAQLINNGPLQMVGPDRTPLLPLRRDA